MFCLYCHAVNNGPLVKQNGFVEYSVNFTNGVKDVSLNSVLTVTLTGGMTPINSTCTSGALTLTVNTPISDPAALVASLFWICTFQVQVDANQKSAGQIAQFDVKFAYSGTQVTGAYYIPAVTTQAVPVYTGGTLAYVSNVANTTDPTRYVNGECIRGYVNLVSQCRASYTYTSATGLLALLHSLCQSNTARSAMEIQCIIGRYHKQASAITDLISAHAPEGKNKVSNSGCSGHECSEQRADG